MAKFTGVLAIGLGAMTLVAWLLMLVVGVVHADWLTAVPTIGYGTALLICSLIWAQQMIRGLAILWVKHLNHTRPPAEPKPVTVTTEVRHNFPRDTTRVHWVNPQRDTGWDLW